MELILPEISKSGRSLNQVLDKFRRIFSVKDVGANI